MAEIQMPGPTTDYVFAQLLADIAAGKKVVVVEPLDPDHPEKRGHVVRVETR